jgi:hypothetical protein
LPDQADRVAEIRARAAEALTPAHMADAIASKADVDIDIDSDDPPEGFLPGGPTATPVSYDAETGEVIEPPDPIAQKVAERRGAAPLGDAPAQDFPG